MIQPHHIDYLLDDLDTDERAEVEARVATDPDEAADLDRLRLTLSMLEADVDAGPPPAGLADRTLARLNVLFAEAAKPTAEPEVDFDPGAAVPPPQASEPRRRNESTDRPEYRWVGGRFRGDLVVACGIGLIAVGMVLSFINRARHASDVAACQHNLLTLHQGLAGYADTHGDRFPEVGTRAYPTADTFVSALAEAGQCPPGFQPRCPAGPATALRSHSPTPVTYTYSLGHLGVNGVVEGLYRSVDPREENDLLPISSDYPVASVAVAPGATSPHGWGHNVLYLAGNVRFAKTAAVGAYGDDAYRNQFGRVAAGVDRTDAVLGAGSARP
jgi:hypothetical protein